MQPKKILIIGTYDTKRDELDFLQQVIEQQGGSVLTMDVSVLGEAGRRVSFSKHEVAAAARSSIPEIVALQEESQAMAVMTRGACLLARGLVERNAIQGMLSLGGTMGTDMALDVAAALPLGLPKYIVSTVAFSPVIQPERLAADVQMILWAGGLHGLNAICRSVLAQAAGAVLGAARAMEPPDLARPLIGVTSLGNACLRYMGRLKPALEARGYEAAFFHSSGMGGRAFEDLAGKGTFAAVLDFCLQEFNNGIHGSIVSSGPGRLRGAGRAGVPQIVVPGAADLVDLPSWQGIPDRFKDRPSHVHNQLITSITLNEEQRRFTARAIADCLHEARGPTHLILPLHGLEEWDREGQVAHAPEDLAAFLDEMRRAVRPPVTVTEVAAHINDEAFTDAALAIFDDWVARGIIAGPGPKAETPPATAVA